MAYNANAARQEMLDELAEAIDHISASLAALGTAYEQLTTAPADRLEEELFGPVQHAYGRARRTHTSFAQRHNLPERTFSPAPQGAPSTGVRGFIDGAVASAEEADEVLAELQDSMMPVEVGDPELRAGLADVRRRLGDLPAQGERLIGRSGR
jgi:hypothetical protein